MTLKQTLFAIVASLACALPLKATDIELGEMYNYASGKASRIVTISQAYKEGKLNLRWKAEKIENALPDVQVIGSYPLANGYYAAASEKINLDPSLEPAQYTTNLGIGKTVGRGDISVNEALSKKVGSDKNSYMTVIGSSYKLSGKAKLCGTLIIPKATPNKPSIKGTIMIGL